MEKKEDSRYPYTHAADFVRSIAGYNEGGTKLSRSDASQIRSKIAKIIGMDDRELACKLADYYLEHRDEITEKNHTEAMSKIFGNQCEPFDETKRLLKDKE